MKKTILCIALSIILVCLSGCKAKGPTVAADGTPWSKDWTMVGSKVGVEDPGADFTIRDVKGAKGMFFTSWSMGEAQDEKPGVYEAQIVLLLQEASSAESAQASVDEWLTLAGENYLVTDTAQQICNGQTFTVLTYNFPSDASSYARGASAFAVYGNCAISAEFACQDAFDGDAAEILTNFLEHCHYAAD